MTRRLRTSLKALAALAVVVFLAVACSSSGFPESYDDQVDEDTGLSNVAQNWLDGCTPSLGEDLADKATIICECSFATIRTDIPFTDFIDLNDDLSDDPTLLEDLNVPNTRVARQVTEIIKNCIADA